MPPPENMPSKPMHQTLQAPEAAEAARAKAPEKVATLLKVGEDYPKAAGRLQDETGKEGTALVEKRLAALSALPPASEAKPEMFKAAATGNL